MAKSKTYLDDEFKSYVQQLLDENHIPGTSIAVVDGETIEQAGYGHASLPDTAATPETLYYTGSTTKAMIGATLGRLMDPSATSSNETASPKALRALQRNQWTTRIKDILPDDFVMQDKLAEANTTIEDALSHRTGMPGCDRLYGEWMGERPKAIVQVLRYLGPLNKLFRNAWQYNNIMYSVLGDVIETVTGAEWGAAMRKMLWLPLGMTSTFWHVDEIPESERARLSTGYFWSEDKYLEEPYVRFAGIAPAGSTISCVADYTKWLRALLSAAKKAHSTTEGDVSSSAQDKEVITPTLFRSLTTPRQIDNSPSLTTNPLMPKLYSLGWSHLPHSLSLTHPLLAHPGGLTGYGTQLYLLPEDGFAVVSMGNTAMSSNMGGEKACLQLMAKKLRLKSKAKEEWMHSVRVMGRAVEAVITVAGAKQEDEAEEDEQTGSSVDVEAMVARYKHAAYGTFVVQAFSSASGTERIKIPKAPADGSLLVYPVGHRTWKDCYLLQHSKKFSQPTNGAANRDNEKTDDVFFNLQRLEGHGKSEGGQFSEPEETLLSATLWQPMEQSEHGACFRSSNRMGLRLANSHLPSDGVTHEGWLEEMAWFDKEQ